MLHRSRRACHCVLLSSCSLLPAAVPPEAATDLSLSYATRRAAADDSCCQFMHCLMNQPGTARAAMTVKGVTVSTLPMPATASDGLRISSLPHAGVRYSTFVRTKIVIQIPHNGLAPHNERTCLCFTPGHSRLDCNSSAACLLRRDARQLDMLL